jgi:hypothetical protein
MFDASPGKIFRMRKKVAFAFLGASLVVFLASSNVAQSVNPIAFGTFNLPCTIDTYGNAWNGARVYCLLRIGEKKGL